MDDAQSISPGFEYNADYLHAPGSFASYIVLDLSPSLVIVDAIASDDRAMRPNLIGS